MCFEPGKKEKKRHFLRLSNSQYFLSTVISTEQELDQGLCVLAGGLHDGRLRDTESQ